MTETQNHKFNLKQNLTLCVALILFSGFLLSAAYLVTSSSRQAEADTLKLGQSLALQSQFLIRPLILANDGVSLNYLLNELEQLDYVQGLQVQDPSGFVTARAGSTAELKLQQHLKQQNKLIGTVTLWLDPTPSRQMQHRQLWPAAILALATIAIALLCIWLLNRREDEGTFNTGETHADADKIHFDQLLAEQTFSEPEPEPEPQQPADPVLTPAEETQADPSPAGDTASEPPIIQQETFSVSTHAQPVSGDAQPTETLSAGDKPDLLHTHDLVDLLKPEREQTPRMPKFEHHPEPLPEENAQDDPLEFEEEELHSQPVPPRAANPLRSMVERHEEQLNLYSFEQELELLLAPQDALYVFYIDSQTASSENMPADEKATLLNVYHHLAKQVARIYNGEAELQENKDILLRFEMHDSEDRHGINALCAGMLFSLLYKGFNQSRIRGFQPVLSLQMSLARGHQSKYQLVKEEAHFLTRTTNSNELISHTALTEAPHLKQALLEQAEIRREDEDKVLLLKVTPKHQTLLQKQANHLLTKIFKKQA
ncbi:hypothetical protein [Neptuniibacter halophilus]|uniref:hypothetical protein n=1 Tax=Neptuniibacter halophilus TaxID=651666 RepID=UPI002572C94D|nr:hypothetical protein [Neptuniibacter halophilus]